MMSISNDDLTTENRMQAFRWARIACSHSTAQNKYIDLVYGSRVTLFQPPHIPLRER